MTAFRLLGTNMKLERIAIAAVVAALSLNLSACGVGEARVASTGVEEAVTPLPVELASPVTALREE